MVARSAHSNPKSITQLPASAWACGACTDAMLFRQSWWIRLPIYFFPGLFVDIMGYNAVSCACYCDFCRARWKAQFGREMGSRK